MAISIYQLYPKNDPPIWRGFPEAGTDGCVPTTWLFCVRLEKQIEYLINHAMDKWAPESH